MLATRHFRQAFASVKKFDFNVSKIICIGPTKIHVATLKATHGEKYPYHPEPFPYEKKKFNLWHETWEWGSDRLNENSKVITVEGNMGVGKNEFAKRLAAEFDMKVFGSTSEDAVYDHQGYDLRNLDQFLPDGAKHYDVQKWLHDPHPEIGRIGSLQINWFMQKCHTYFRALTHLLNTGQGVVIVRSPFSDKTIVDALYAMGWVSKNFLLYHNEIQEAALAELLAPHVTVFLDASIQKCRERINARKDPREINARNLSDKFLEMVDRQHKEKFLIKMRRTGEVLHVDWETIADDLDMDAIAEEMCVFPLVGVDNEDPKFLQWTRMAEEDLCAYRKLYQDPNNIDWVIETRGTPYECTELGMDFDSAMAYKRYVLAHPAVRYEKGWAAELGFNTAFRA